MAHVSPSGSKYLHFCHGLNVPEIYIRDAKSSEIVAILESGTKVEQQGYPVFFDTYPLPGGFLAYTKMLVPSNYNPSGSYPVVVETYGGPGYGMVDSDTGFSWERVLVDTFNIVYIFIDGRGTGYQSNDHMFQMYLGLGTVEVEDQINVLQQMSQQYSFLDMSKTGIWGMSYGGYATGMAMARDVTNIYKCGASVSPVTDWRFANTIATEKFLDLPYPSDQLASYDQASILNKLSNFVNKKYVVFHGTADDTVHYQNSMMLVKGLELLDIPYVILVPS